MKISADKLILVPEALNSRNKLIKSLKSYSGLSKFLMQQGYFPEPNILPPFLNISLRKSGIGDLNQRAAIDLHVPKSTNQWREFKIPHAHNHQKTCEILEKHIKIVAQLLAKPSKIISYSTPQVADKANQRAGKQINRWVKLQQDLLINSSRHNLPILLEADIQSCYHLLYTHAIEWAFKDLGHENVGKDFDVVIRKGNDNRTHGLPVGPLTSEIIAECVLSYVDIKLEKDINDCETICFRFKPFSPSKISMSNSAEDFSIKSATEIFGNSFLLVDGIFDG